MNTVEFAGLCGFYGWKRLNRKSKTYLTIQHERGVKVVISRKLLLLASEYQIVAILKIAAQIGREETE